ncbi:MAG: hypothetical protein DRQ56_10440 [Gammaproteobacteria bacterium]|nr:MAG: hypothetical protein DRQ56_10440 [Gammaproteobacteria bacterium]HDY82561.1 PaaI family thioesterase [Halieaceae bacterium]
MSELLDQYKTDPWAVHWGIEAESVTDDMALVKLPYREIQLNHADGVVHGGVLATVMQDAGLLLVCKGYDIQPQQAELLDMQISYLSGTRDKDVTVTAQYSRRGRRFAFIHAEITDERGRLIANSQILFRAQADGEPGKSEALIYTSPDPLQLGGEDNHPIADGHFGPNLKARSGLEVTHITECRTQVLMPVNPMYKDFRGQTANGVILHMADSAGVFGLFAYVNRPVHAATIDFKMTFCEASRDEQLLATSISLKQNGNVMFNKVEVHTRSTGRLIAFGTQTFWLDI